VIHLARDPGGGPRRVTEICLLRRGADGLVHAVPAMSFSNGSLVEGPGAGELRQRIAARSSP
jgi:pilus assembly protein CpaF